MWINIFLRPIFLDHLHLHHCYSIKGFCGLQDHTDKKVYFHDREWAAASELTRIAFAPSHAVAFASFLDEAQVKKKCFFLLLSFWFFMQCLKSTCTEYEAQCIPNFCTCVQKCTFSSLGEECKGHSVEFLLGVTVRDCRREAFILFHLISQ